MKRTILSLLIAGMFAGTSATVMAQNVTAGEEPGQEIQEMGSPEMASPDMASPDKDLANQGSDTTAADSNAATADADASAGMTGDASDPSYTDAELGADMSAGTDSADADAGALAESGFDYDAAVADALTQYKDATAKCGSAQTDAGRTCVTDAESARTEALAEANTEALKAAAPKASDKDDLGNEPGPNQGEIHGELDQQSQEAGVQEQSQGPNQGEIHGELDQQSQEAGVQGQSQDQIEPQVQSQEDQYPETRADSGTDVQDDASVAADDESRTSAQAE
jgi:hypothetical protein